MYEEELESKKKQAIQDVVHAVYEQLEKDKIITGDMNFSKLQYIEKKEDGSIEVSFPLGKDSYGNYCYITILPDGKAKISGVQTSPEKRDGITKTHNGSFDIELKVENWKETESIIEVTETGFGKEPEKRGILDNVLPQVIDKEFMVKKLVSLYPDLLHEENSPEVTSAELNEYEIMKSKGKISTIPNFWGNFSNEEIMCLTPEAAAIFLEKITEMVDNGADYEDIILYENAGYSAWDGNTYDVTYNIESGSLGGDILDFYIIGKDGIVLQNESVLKYPNGHEVMVEPVDEKKLEQQYNRYKEAVLTCIGKGINIDYGSFINEDLRNDADFKKRASELLIKIKNQGYSFAEEIGEKIEFVDHPHNSEHDADKHDLSEIEGAIKDRKTGDINKVIEEISTEMEKAKSSER